VNTEDLVRQHFTDSIETKISTADTMSTKIAEAGQLMAQGLINGSKIFTCGNGCSAADAQHFAAQLINRYEMERPPLPAIALTTNTSTITAVARDYHYNSVFSKQLYALAQHDDILLAISTTGHSENILAAVKVAQEKDMKLIVLSGGDGGKLSGLLREQDIEIRVASNSAARIHENHTLIIHCFCDLIDQTLFGA